ncbi:hypothetical protein AAII07_45675 [Microvirga sp. 0TCS3.31]
MIERRSPFYAGAPLIYQDNIHLGSLCVLDTQPRSFSRGDRAELRELADRAVSVMATQEIEALMQASKRRPM